MKLGRVRTPEMHAAAELYVHRKLRQQLALREVKRKEKTYLFVCFDVCCLQ